MEPDQPESYQDSPIYISLKIDQLSPRQEMELERINEMFLLDLVELYSISNDIFEFDSETPTFCILKGTVGMNDSELFCSWDIEERFWRVEWVLVSVHFSDESESLKVVDVPIVDHLMFKECM